MGFFGFPEDDSQLDDADSWAEATAAYRTGLKFARDWQPDAHTALTDATDYPPAHQNDEGEWVIYYWSPGVVKGLVVFLDSGLELVRQEEWGAFYRDLAVKVGEEVLSYYGFAYTPQAGQNGPDGLSFVFSKAEEGKPTRFIDIQISTTVMLTPPPRRFTINLVANHGLRPLYGAGGGFETRLSTLIPGHNPDYWWGFRDEEDYEVRLREALQLAVDYGLPALDQAL